MYRFAAFYKRRDSADASREWIHYVTEVQRIIPGSQKIYHSESLILLEWIDVTRSMNSHVLTGFSGVILGNLFTPKPSGDDYEPSSSPPRRLSERESCNIVSTNGQWLRDNYWGSYVAILEAPQKKMLQIIRSPLGSLPCYHYDLGNISILFSDADFLRYLRNFNPGVDLILATANVPFPLLTTELTPIQNLTLVKQSHCLIVTSNKIEYSQHWSPISHCTSQYIDGLEPEVRQMLQVRMRNIVLSCTATWMSAYPNALLALSDGLDSSLLAGIIAKLPDRPNLVCATACEDAEFDDTVEFAKMTAESAGLPHELIEQNSAASNFDLFFNCPPVPWPILIDCDNSPSYREAAIAARYGAIARLRGDGGDSLFGRYGFNIAARDYAHDHPISTEYFGVAMRSALVSDRTFWSGLSVMLAIKFGFSPAISKEMTGSMDIAWGLNIDAFHQMCLVNKNSQTDYSGKKVSEGSRLRSESIMSEFNYFHIEKDIPFLEPIRPYYSQPLVEFFLSIPTYVLQFNGRERGFVRSTFADCLIDPIRLGLYKKDGSSFYDKVITRNLPFLKSFLLDGVLAKHDILDKRSIEKVFTTPGYATSVHYTRLLIIAGVEAWARAWTT